jgi:hypothetical protein
MSGARINAFVGGVVGGFAAVGITTVATQALQIYQQRQAQDWMQQGFVGIGGDEQ